MRIPQYVSTFFGRLATFEGPVQLPKRRPSSSAKKRGPTTVSWPHEAPNPEQLAMAGFFYRPTAHEHDNVTCFLCKKSLDGWVSQDEPAIEHLIHSPECAWALHACISLRSEDPNRAEEDPMTERMVAARTDTFQNSWPHEHKKGWKCKTQKMVEAGWCYDPSPENDDGVTCFYCGVSLDGWEPKDDPWEEHQRRSPKCYFLSAVGTSNTNRMSSQSKKGRGSRATKTSQISRPSNLTAYSEAPSFTSRGESEPREEESVLTTATAATTTSKTGKTRKGASRAKAGAKGKKSTRSKKATQDKPEPIDGDETEIRETAEPSPKSKRGGTRQAARMIEISDLGSPLAESHPASGRAARFQTEGVRPRLSEDESQLQSELLAATSVQEAERPPVMRGKKRTSDGMAKLDSSIVMFEEPPESFISQSQKPKRAKKGGKRTTAQEPSLQHTESASRTSKEGLPYFDRSETHQEKVCQTDEDVDMMMDAAEEHPISGPASVDPPPHNPPVTQEASRKEQASMTVSFGHIPEASSSRSTKPATPSPSPQSSDAENKPPSSRPALHQSQQARQAINVPLAKETLIATPSRRLGISNRLETSCPWKPIDLENVFVPSPSSKAAFGAGFANGTENISSLEGLPLDQMIKGVEARLTSPEKGMSVEDWIKFNARRGEQRLRDECERLVGIFETEGGKALHALEGIECAM